MFQFQSIDRKRLMSQLQEIRQEVRLSVLFGSSSDWKGPHSHGRTVCFTASTDSNGHLTQHKD